MFFLQSLIDIKYFSSGSKPLFFVTRIHLKNVFFFSPKTLLTPIPDNPDEEGPLRGDPAIPAVVGPPRDVPPIPTEVGPTREVPPIPPEVGPPPRDIL
jgi:hypothetical protein